MTEAKEVTKPEPQGYVYLYIYDNVNFGNLANLLADSPDSSRRLEIKQDKSAATKSETLPTAASKAIPGLDSRQDGQAAAKPAIPQKPGSEYPAIHDSTIDIDAAPILDATGKSIFKTDMDADVGGDDKPWRRPGIDQTDFFNYGFDEFTWSSYCLKQDTLRNEAKEQKKQVEDMQKFLGMPGGVGGAATNGPSNPGAAAAVGGMPGADGFPPEMMAMMQQMMGSGMDPTQMDFNQFMQMAGGQGAPGGAGNGYGGPGMGPNMGGGGGGYGGGGGPGMGGVGARRGRRGPRGHGHHHGD